MNVVLAEYLTFLLLIEKRRVSFKRRFLHFAAPFRFLLSPQRHFSWFSQVLLFLLYYQPHLTLVKEESVKMYYTVIFHHCHLKDGLPSLQCKYSSLRDYKFLQFGKRVVG